MSDGRLTGTKFVPISIYPNLQGEGILKHHCVPPPEVIDEFIKTDMTKNNGYGVFGIRITSSQIVQKFYE